jgi:NADH:ubiquinone oxidoreductase subunit F (NADH-binding)/NADH:ubiquinone oxidoreductase subunit E
MTFDRYEALRGWAEKSVTSSGEIPEISIALGSCSLAVGADEVFRAVDETLRREGLEARLRKTGCPGLCGDEVLVSIAKPGYPPITYREMTPLSVQELVVDFLKGDDPRSDLALAAEEPLEGIPSWEDLTFWAKQERQVLAHCGQIDPGSLEEYIIRDGYGGLDRALQLTPEEVIAEVTKSGLRGRGGAGFPTGRKWEFCRAAPGEVKYLICNADESEPGSFKDRLIMEGDPHRVIEGVAIAAYAIGAQEAYIYVRGEYRLAAERLEEAVQQAQEAGLLGEGVLGSNFSLEVKVHRGAGAYICGEETALIESLEGKRGVPRMRPPYPPSYGLWGRPTVVNNVETLAALPDIVRRGADWYRRWGTERSPGTKVYTLLGDVHRPLAFEAPLGLTLKEAIGVYGGGVKNGFRWAQTGGSSGTVVPESRLESPLDYDSMIRSGVSLGSGALLVADERRDVAWFLASVINFFRVESCGKCTPCREGTLRAQEILERLATGRGEEGALGMLTALAEALRLASFCGLGTAAALPLDTALEHFKGELGRGRRVSKGVKIKPGEGKDGLASPDVEQVAEIIAQHGKEPEALVETLRHLDTRWGYLPREALRVVAQAYQMPPSQLYGVASFYSLLSTVPRGEHLIRCCESAPCELSGSGQILEAVKEALGIDVGQTTEDGKFTLETTSCLGLCGVGPVLTVDEKVYGRLTPERANDILNGYR